MANITIPNLPQAVSLDGTEQLLGVQSGTSKSITTGQIVSLVVGGGGATPLAVSVGGTGNTTFDNYGLLYGNGTAPVEAIAPPTGADYILVGSPGAVPVWQENIPVTSGVNSITFGTTGLTPNTATEGNITVAGTLATANGGTNLTSFTADGAVYATSTSVLTTGTLPAISGGTGQSSYTVGDLLYADTTTTLAKLADVASGAVLISGGVAGNPSYSASPTLTTSLTTPLINGGTDASSTLTLQSTSGTGTTDAILFKTGSQVEKMRITSNGNVGIGTTSLTNMNLRVSKDITGSTSAYGVYEDGAVQSDVTAIGAYYATAASVPSGTLSNLFHFYATQGTVGATVTAQSAFSSANNLIAATNNYAFFAGNTVGVTTGKFAHGFYSAINTATGGGTTFGFYGAGTAQNIFRGDTRVGSLTAPTKTLDITGTLGVSGAVTFDTALPVASGGTGATTPNAALTNLTTFTTTATASGTTVLTNTSTYFQFFTGTLTQTITLPVTSTLGTGWTFHIVNNSTGNLTVNSSGGNLVITVLSGTTAMVTCQSTGATTAADWESGLTDFSTATGTGSVVLATSPTIVTPTITTSATSPIIYGGTGAASTLGLYSTSGAGTTDNISLYTGSQVQAMRVRTDQNIVIGTGAGSAFNSLAVSKNITGNTVSTAVLSDGIVQSGVTSTSVSFHSNMALAAATFTTSAAAHFYANPSAGGAGSTITSQYGFLAESTLGTSGAATITNAYGFFGSLAAATNRYNIYTGGTANNFFNGYSFGLGGVMATTTSTATNTVTLTSTQVASGFIVGTPTATASYTLPLATDLDTALSNAATGYNFELTVFTTAAFAITLLTNTGWTLLGSMATGATANSFARFRARKTGVATYTLYRVS